MYISQSKKQIILGVSTLNLELIVAQPLNLHFKCIKTTECAFSIKKEKKL